MVRYAAHAWRLAAFLMLAAFQQPLLAETFVVNDMADVADANPGDGFCETAAANGVCTLRAALQEANRARARGVVKLPAGFYQIAAARSDPAFQSEIAGSFSIGGIDIVGAGESLTIIDGGALDNVLSVQAGSGTASISNLTVQNGRVVADAMGLGFAGGGITNSAGTLKLKNVVVQNNEGVFSAGVGNFGGTLIIESSTITGNTNASRSSPSFQSLTSTGAGVYNSFRGKLIIRNSTISNNRIIFDEMNASSVRGAGITNNAGTMTLTNVTVSGNSGGGIDSVGAGDNALVNVTIVGNTPSLAGFAGGLAVNGFIENGTAIPVSHTIKNSIIADNGTFNCVGALISQGYNIEKQANDSCGFTTDATSTSGVDPRLGSLLANGGPTKTHALLSGSPAINQGDPSGCADASGPLTVDQRGGRRAIGGRCDIGAYEFLSPVAVAGTDRRVRAGSMVQLDGTASRANDGAVPTFQWTQTGGATVSLAGANTASPTFTAPMTAGPLSFQLALTDSVVTPEESHATVSVVVNAPPTASAGTNLNNFAGEFVVLDGSASTDSDGSLVSFSWSQVSGAPVTLTGARTAKPNFVAPGVTSALIFQLTVTDTDGQTATSSVTVNVTQTSPPPRRDNVGGGGGGGSLSLLMLFSLALLAIFAHVTRSRFALRRS